MTDADAAPEPETADGGGADAADGVDEAPAGQDDATPRREVAYRVLAAEYEHATHSYTAGDEDRSPTYVVTPTGARANRLFVVGVLTATERVSDEVVRARIADPTGTFVVYAGQYQPEARAFFEEAESPSFVALTGKARTFEPEDGDQIYTSVRPETVATVDAETRDYWAVRTARRTVERVDTMADAIQRGTTDAGELREAGLQPGLATGIPRALANYDTGATYLADLRRTARELAELVAGERDAVDAPTTTPDAPGSDEGSLPTILSRLGEGTPDREEAGVAVEAEATVAATPLSTDEGAEQTDAAAEQTDATAESTDAVVEQTTDTASKSVADATPEGATEPNPESGPGTGAPQAESAESDGRVAADGDDMQPGPADGGSTADGETGAPAPGQGTVDTADPTGGAEPDGTAETAVADEGFELDDEERERIESEYGTEFETGTEVDEPGTADIQTPDPEPAADVDGAEATDESAATASAEPEGAETSGTPATAESQSADATTGDDANAATGDDADGAPSLDDAVVSAMTALDDGDGADREAVVDRAVDETGADPDAVEDAIQDVLMDGRCYEPDESTLKPL